MRALTILAAILTLGAPSVAPEQLERVSCEQAATLRSRGSSQAVNVTFTNTGAARVELEWVDFQGARKSYGFIAPHGTREQSTYDGHVWLLTDASGRCSSAFIAHAPPQSPTVRAAHERVERGITYRVPEGVSPAALQRAELVVDAMLAPLPEVRASMARARFKVELIPEDQVLSDLPDYAQLRGRETRDGRDFDRGTRGLGGRDLCSVGEENLLCRARQPYPSEDVLVHEFAHSVEAHLPASTVAEIDAAFRDARARSLYPAQGYNQRDAKEYFAEGVQAWFGATVRADVNGGINTREKLRTHDPALARVLAKLFGSADVPRAEGCAY